MKDFADLIGDIKIARALNKIKKHKKSHDYLQAFSTLIEDCNFIKKYPGIVPAVFFAFDHENADHYMGDFLKIIKKIPGFCENNPSFLNLLADKASSGHGFSLLKTAAGIPDFLKDNPYFSGTIIRKLHDRLEESLGLFKKAGVVIDAEFAGEVIKECKNDTEVIKTAKFFAGIKGFLQKNYEVIAYPHYYHPRGEKHTALVPACSSAGQVSLAQVFACEEITISMGVAIAMFDKACGRDYPELLRQVIECGDAIHCYSGEFNLNVAKDCDKSRMGALLPIFDKIDYWSEQNPDIICYIVKNQEGSLDKIVPYVPLAVWENEENGIAKFVFEKASNKYLNKALGMLSDEVKDSLWFINFKKHEVARRKHEAHLKRNPGGSKQVAIRASHQGKESQAKLVSNSFFSHN